MCELSDIIDLTFYNFHHPTASMHSPPADPSSPLSSEWQQCATRNNPTRTLYSHSFSSQKRQCIHLKGVPFTDLELYTSRQHYSFPFCPIVHKCKIQHTQYQQSSLYCHLEIVIEHVPHRMTHSTNGKIKQKLQQKIVDVVEGFHYLFKKHGAFQIRPGMIGMTELGVVKVWHNEDWISHQKQAIKGEIQMIDTLKKVLEQYLGVRYPWSFASSFVKVIQILEGNSLQMKHKHNHSSRLSSGKQNNPRNRQVTFQRSIEKATSQSRIPSLADTCSYQAAADQNYCKTPTAGQKTFSRFSKATQQISQQGSSDKSVSQSSFQWFRPNQIIKGGQKKGKSDQTYASVSMKDAKIPQRPESKSFAEVKKPPQRRYSQRVSCEDQVKNYNCKDKFENYCDKVLQEELDCLFVAEKTFDQKHLEKELESMF